MRRVKTDLELKVSDEVEVDCLASSDGSTVRIMVYNFKNDLNYQDRVKYKMQIKLPVKSKKVLVTSYLVCDDCNFFDEWIADCETLGITSADFAWSPDDTMLDMAVTLKSESGIRKYKTMRDKYIKCSRLKPVTKVTDVKKGVITIEDSLNAHNVLFLEIKPLKKR